MADICGLSTEYFVRLFKATLQVSPYQYVLNRRVERARSYSAKTSKASQTLRFNAAFRIRSI